MDKKRKTRILGYFLLVILWVIVGLVTLLVTDTISKISYAVLWILLLTVYFERAVTLLYSPDKEEEV